MTELLAADPNQGNPVGAGMTFAYCFALVLDGRIDEAVAVAQLVHDETVRSGSPADQALAATLVARMHLFAGRPATARDLADRRWPRVSRSVRTRGRFFRPPCWRWP